MCRLKKIPLNYHLQACEYFFVGVILIIICSLSVLLCVL